MRTGSFFYPRASRQSGSGRGLDRAKGDHRTGESSGRGGRGPGRRDAAAANTGSPMSHGPRAGSWALWHTVTWCWRLSLVAGAWRPGVELPAAGVQPVLHWRRELAAESGW